MISRAHVERAILDEEAMLERVVSLLESRSDLTVWPQDARAALALALEDDAVSRAESWKTVALRRHLFGPEATVPEQLTAPKEPSALDRRHAERIRSGLLACVPYRIATYLLRA